MPFPSFPPNTLLTSPTKKYTTISTLGKGTYGLVYKAHSAAHSAADFAQNNQNTYDAHSAQNTYDAYTAQKTTTYAIKVLRSEPPFYRHGLSEIRILSKLRNSPLFVHYFESFIFKGHLCIVLECLDKNLYEILQCTGFSGFDHPTIKKISYQVLTALEELHKMEIVHCDLKPENILLHDVENIKVKVIDFGNATTERSTNFYVQSRYYRAPEVILGLEYGSPVDVWSFGCILYEMFVGVPLFPGRDNVEQVGRICSLVGVPGFMVEYGRNSGRYFDLVSKQILSDCIDDCVGFHGGNGFAMKSNGKGKGLNFVYDKNIVNGVDLNVVPENYAEPENGKNEINAKPEEPENYDFLTSNDFDTKIFKKGKNANRVSDMDDPPPNSGNQHVHYNDNRQYVNHNVSNSHKLNSHKLNDKLNNIKADNNDNNEQNNKNNDNNEQNNKNNDNKQIQNIKNTKRFCKNRYMTHNQFRQKILMKDINFLETTRLLNFLLSILKANPLERPTAFQCRKDAYLNDLSFTYEPIKMTSEVRVEDRDQPNPEPVDGHGRTMSIGDLGALQRDIARRRKKSAYERYEFKENEK